MMLHFEIPLDFRHFVALFTGRLQLDWIVITERVEGTHNGCEVANISQTEEQRIVA